jgi:hypothetical protein
MTDGVERRGLHVQAELLRDANIRVYLVFAVVIKLSVAPDSSVET